MLFFYEVFINKRLRNNKKERRRRNFVCSFGFFLVKWNCIKVEVRCSKMGFIDEIVCFDFDDNWKKVISEMLEIVYWVLEEKGYNFIN